MPERPFQAFERPDNSQIELLDPTSGKEEGLFATPPLAVHAPVYSPDATKLAVFAVIMYSIWWSYRHGGMDAWPPGMFHGDPDIPRWIAFAAVVAVYAIVAIPIGAGRRADAIFINETERDHMCDAVHDVRIDLAAPVAGDVADKLLPVAG